MNSPLSEADRIYLTDLGKLFLLATVLIGFEMWFIENTPEPPRSAETEMLEQPMYLLATREAIKSAYEPDPFEVMKRIEWKMDQEEAANPQPPELPQGPQLTILSSL